MWMCELIYTRETEQVCVVAMFWTFVREVLYSNLDLDTEYSE
jgi:hypothetical protein